MESKELIEYIKSQINNNVSKEEITKILQEQGGWADKDITDAFFVVEQNVENQNPEVEKVEEKPEEKKERPEIQPETFGKKSSNHSFQIVAVIMVLAVISIGGYFGVKHFSVLADLDEIETEEVKDDKVTEELPSDYEIKNGKVYYGGRLIEGAAPKTFEYLGEGYTKDANKVFYGKQIVEGADPKTFKLLKEKYTKDENSVYWGDETIEGADSETFEIFNEDYAKDKNNVYFMRYVIKRADLSTFEILNEGYAKDKNYVYDGLYIIKEADPLTFEVLGKDYSKDKNNIYFWDDVIEGADLPTFEVLSEGYAKDKNNAYFWGKKIEGTDPLTFELIIDGYAKDTSHSYYAAEQLEFNIDWDTFTGINLYYHKDVHNVYYKGKIVEGADPNTVELLDGRCALIEGSAEADQPLRDKNGIYCHEKKLEVEDPISFRLVSCTWSGLSSNCTWEDVYATYQGSYILNNDEWKVVWETTDFKIPKGADLETFEVLGCCSFVEKWSVDYTKDKNNVFCGGIKIEGADPETFEVVSMVEGDGLPAGTAIARDASNVYFGSVLLEGVDGSTMVVLSDSYIKDKNHVYLLRDHYGDNNTAQIVERADLETFEIINYQYAKDKNYVYQQGEIIEGVNQANCTADNLDGCKAPTE